MGGAGCHHQRKAEMFAGRAPPQNGGFLNSTSQLTHGEEGGGYQDQPGQEEP